MLKEEIVRFQKEINNALIPEYKFYTDMIDDIYKFIPSESFAFFVCSFSEEKDLLSQWRGYCPEGIGFSIGFDLSSLKKWAKQNNCTLEPCIYDAKEQRTLLRSLIEKISVRYNTELNKTSHESNYDKEIAISGDLLWDFAELAPTFKHPKFKEEKEWRIIASRSFIPEGLLDLIKYRDGKSMVDPYIEIPLPLDGENLDINQIVVGPTHDPILSKASVELLLKSYNGKFNEVQYSTIPFRNW